MRILSLKLKLQVGEDLTRTFRVLLSLLVKCSEGEQEIDHEGAPGAQGQTGLDDEEQQDSSYASGRVGQYRLHSFVNVLRNYVRKNKFEFLILNNYIKGISNSLYNSYEISIIQFL